MKLHLPLSLLLPVVTPLGDLSGLLLVAWQFDGLVAVVIGVAAMNAVPSAPGAAALAVVVAAYCVRAGLRRTGWARRGLVSRLRRVRGRTRPHPDRDGAVLGGLRTGCGSEDRAARVTVRPRRERGSGLLGLLVIGQVGDLRGSSLWGADLAF
ncbi:hypothetical protein ACFFKE_18585 [Streptomyces mutabilis]|uniref:hypothetical protein n=1 Tax=Streptomyces mutabilis TaxID=67332 RepID=UPI00199DB12E|nr:hypothetical protein [Streptomyces mutabilis]GGQ26499.1 hypothetical protein GCM10010279_38210 [Streptomyces mutabilis]